MKIGKIIAAICASASVTAVTSIAAGASSLIIVKNPEPGLSSGSGSWLIQLYNKGNADEQKNSVDYGIDYSAVTGARFTVTVPEKDNSGEAGNREFWDGATGGSVVLSINGGDIEQYSEVWDKYNWPTKQYWGVYDEALEICTDPNRDDDPLNDNEISYEKIGDYTYELTANGFENPLANGDAKKIGCMQLCLQEWGSSIANLEVVKCEVIDEAGNALLTFDGKGKLIGSITGNLNKVAYCKTKRLSDGTLKVIGYTGVPVDFEIPETINGKKVTVIDDFAFKGCTTLKSIKIPDSVVSVGDLAFYQCPALENITWSKKVRNVGNLAFYGCVSLKDTTLPSSVISIGNQVFYGCNLMESITIPKSVTEIGDNAFGKCAKVNIKCYTNSTAEKYAKDNKIKYTLLDAKKPSDMKNFRCTAKTDTSLSLVWNKNSTADGYIVEMYQNGKWARVAKITNNSTTTFRKAGLKAGTAYKFRVRAYKMNGSVALYSDYSATVAARTNPSVIKGAKLTGRAADALRINWTKNASADGYIVEMYQGNKWVRAAKITNNSTTTFRKAGLKASTVYKFRVRAYKMSGSTALYGNFSATVTARTNPSVMKGVKIAGKAKDALRVNWTKNSSAQGYIVEMYKGGKWVRVAKITNNSTTTFRKSGLAKNTTYKFRVKAYYMSGKTALYGNYGSVSGKTAAK